MVGVIAEDAVIVKDEVRALGKLEVSPQNHVHECNKSNKSLTQISAFNDVLVKTKDHLSIELYRPKGIWGIRVQLRKTIEAHSVANQGRVTESNAKSLSLKVPFRDWLIKKIVHLKVELCFRVFKRH